MKKVYQVQYARERERERERERDGKSHINKEIDPLKMTNMAVVGRSTYSSIHAFDASALFCENNIMTIEQAQNKLVTIIVHENKCICNSIYYLSLQYCLFLPHVRTWIISEAIYCLSYLL